MKELLIFITLIAGLSCAITAEGCRRAIARGRRPAYWIALVGTVASPLLIVVLLTLLLNGWEMFTLRFWEDGLTSIVFVICILVGMFIGLLPACKVVLYYRQKSNNSNVPPEREADEF